MHISRPPSYLLFQILVIISFSFSDGLPLQFPGFYLYLASSGLRKIEHVIMLSWTSLCRIAVLLCHFWLNNYLKVAKWKFSVNFHKFWMLSFEEIFQHQIFNNYKLPSCGLQIAKYLTYLALITLWPVFSRVFTFGRMFFKSGLEGLGFKTILFIGTARLTALTNLDYPEDLNSPLLFDSLEDGGVKRVKGGRGTERLLKIYFYQLNFNLNFTYL